MQRVLSRSLHHAILIVFASICPIMQTVVLGQTFTHSNRELGLPLIHNYSPKEYGAGPQNVGIKQDTRGILYIANFNARLVLEFDGVNWRRTRLPNQFAPTSTAIDNNDSIYLGATNDFGVLTPDSLGTLHFRSLLKHAKPEDRQFSGVESTYTTEHGVYFHSMQRLFRWHSDTLKVWQPRTAFNKSFFVHDDLYVYQDRLGLMKVEGDSLKMVSGGDRFAALPIIAMFPIPENSTDKRERFLLGIGGEGLFLYDSASLQPFPGEASNFVRRYGVRCSAVLNDSTFAIASIDHGVVIFDASGKMVQIVDESAGLVSNIVHEIIPDRGDGIWLATLQGLSRVSGIRPALTIFDERLGVQGVVGAFPIRHRGVLYIRTTRGVYYLDPQNSMFIPVTGLKGELWYLFENGGSLYAARESLYKINGSSATFVKELEAGVIALKTSLFDSNLVFFSAQDGGFRALLNRRGNWTVGPRIGGFPHNIWYFAEENNGDLWLGLRGTGTIRLRLFSNESSPDFKFFDTKDGLPIGQIRVVGTSLGVKFIGSSGIFRFNEDTESFLPDSTFGSSLANGSMGVECLMEDDRGNIWLSVVDGANYFLNVSRRQANGGFLHERTPFLDLPSAGIWTVFPDTSGIVWFGGEEGLFRYDDNMHQNKVTDFPALIRRVIVNEDSVIYNGSSTSVLKAELTYAQNNMRFECAAASFDLPAATRFQFFLEGFDKDWSNWSDEPHKDYTNLPEGNYTFHVRARNVYEHLSSEARLSFVILSPWRRTWQAYALYTFFVVATFYFLRRYEQNRQHLKHEVELQRVEHEKLQEVNALKSRFFANISHEFRTPLTLILGQIESLLAKDPNAEDKSKLQMAFGNAKQLLRLINQLLDLSKIEAGSMTLNATRQNIVPLLKNLTASFESVARQKQIELGFECTQATIHVHFEHDKIEKMMHNLLSNAVKFTPEGGRVSVQLAVSGDQLSAARLNTENWLLITVRDSGIGIPRDRLAHVFDRFYQAHEVRAGSISTTHTREHEGTGIGLALTKELVELHGGAISVESTEGFGTTFLVRLPVISDPASVAGDQLSVADTEQSVPDLKRSESNIASEQSEDTDSSKLPSTSRDFVLVIEDNSDVREYIRQNLADSYRVFQAKDGEDGFKKAQEYIPDLIISDVMMPRLDGYELARQLRAHELTSHIPIIMLTAKAAEEEKLEGLETGVDAYLIKPFSTKELRVRVRKLIEIRRKLRAQTQHKPGVKAFDVAVTPVDQKFLQRLQKVAEENLGNEHFQVESLCKQMGMSQRQLHRKLVALLDHSPKSYLRQLRLDRAKQLLEKNAGTVSEIAFQVGYGNVSSFSRAFREVFGSSPSDFQKKG